MNKANLEKMQKTSIGEKAKNKTQLKKEFMEMTGSGGKKKQH